MDISLEAIIFYALLIDALGMNLIAWSGLRESFTRHFSILARFFPITRGWALYYLILVLWIGSLLSRLGIGSLW